MPQLGRGFNAGITGAALVSQNVKHLGTMKISTSLYLVAVIWVGCARQHFTNGSGDASAFILRQTIAHGGRPFSTNSLPLVGEQWRYVKDEYGVVMRLPLDRFAAVESFLRQSFGEPSIPVVDTIDGGKLGVYGVTAIGAGVQFGYDKDTTFVNILRPISMKEMAEHLPKALKELEKIK